MLVGEPADWLEHFRSLEEQMAEAIEIAWPICIKPLQPVKGAMTHEDHITNHLVVALIKTKKVPGRIIPQHRFLIEDANQAVTISGNIDFVLTIGDNETEHLACECKRLNVPYKSGMKGLVGEYVKDGLMRFITGQYADGLPLAMMLGYVMNAKVDRARRGLHRAMTTRSSTINFRSARDILIAAGRPMRFATTHQCAAGHDIEISHALLGWP